MRNPPSSLVRVIVGARVSHVQGSEKLSHIDQHDTGEKYALGKGWTIVGSFEDLDVSALKTTPWERPDLKPWLTEHSHEWDALIVSKTDRLFRSAKDCVDLSHWFEQNRKILVIVEEGLTLDFYHPQDELDPWAQAMAKVFLLLASVFAEMEGRRFVQRAKGRVRSLRSTDRWSHGSPRFGYQIVDHPSGTGKALDLQPEEQAVLHDIANRFLSGKRIGTITAELIDEGVMPSRDMRRVARGEKPEGERWTHNKVEVLLTSPSTQGIKVRDGRPALDAEGRPIRVGPPSFDPGVWAQIQRRIAAMPRAPREHSFGANPMSGVGFCSCGASLRNHNNLKPNGKTHRYYRCNKMPRQCPRHSVRADEADELVEQTFLERLGDAPAQRRWFDPGEDASLDLAEVESTIEALRADRALGLFSSPEDEATYRSQMGALVARRDDLKSRPIRPAGWAFEPTGRTYREVWVESDTVGRRQLLMDAGVRYTLLGPREADLYIPENAAEVIRQNLRP